MIHTALLGAGMMGATHARAHNNVTRARLTWVFDRNLDDARRIARQHGAQATDDLSQVLADPSLDAVDICLPTDMHREFTLKAAAAGKHVFCEKPMARTVADARAMDEACRRAGVTLMVGHVVRFFVQYASVRDLVLRGDIGEPRVIRATRAGAFPGWSSNDWYGDYTRSGGPIVDLIIHDIDFIRWTFGDVERVYARSKDHHALVVMRLQSGAICHVEGSWARPPGAPFFTALEIAGTRGVYTEDNQSSVPLRTHRNVDGQYEYVPDSPQEENPYAVQLEHFYTCIAEDREPVISGADAIATLATVLAAYKSSLSGRPVDVQEVMA